jgi:hypothetical protein
MNASNPLDTLAAAMGNAAFQAFPEFEYEDRDWEEFARTKKDVRIQKKRRHTLHDVTVYAMFEQTWSSTALGFGGIGGQAITGAYVCVINSNLLGNQYAVYFGGRLAYVINRPNRKFFEDIAGRCMVDKAQGVSTYE